MIGWLIMPTAATLCNTQSWRLVMSICQRKGISWSKRKKKEEKKGLAPTLLLLRSFGEAEVAAVPLLPEM